VKEELFKRIIIVFLINFCYPFNLGLYDFVFPDVTPISISKNNFGVRNFEVNEELRMFFQTQNWIAENLYFSGSLSPSTNNKVDIIYNLNFGFQSSFEKEKFKNIYYDLGYYYKRLETTYADKQKWTSLSMIFGIQLKNSWIFPSYVYIYDKNENDNKYESFVCIDYLKEINKNFIFKIGLQFYDNDYDNDNLKIKPFFSIKYKI